MTATSAGDLVRLLRECQLLEEAHVEELQRTPQALDVDVPTLTQCLVQLGWVTAYQVEQVQKGAGQLLNLGPYRVLECLGENALGATFQARQTGTKAVVVLRIIRHDLLTDPAVLESWKDEVQRAARLLHPYLGQVREVQEPMEGLHAYVRDFIEGRDLATLVREQGALSVPQACDFIRQAAQGLHRAHMEGLTHRHVRASNLIAVSAKGNGAGPVKVVDLGLSLLQEPRKPARPVSRGSAPVADIDDVRLDLEGLGKAFHFILSGKEDGELLAGVPADVQTIIRGMLGTGIERFRNLSDVARVLEPFCAAAPAAPAEVPAAAADIPVATPVEPPAPAPPEATPQAAETPAAPSTAEPAAPASTPEVPASFFAESAPAETSGAAPAESGITEPARGDVPVGQVPAAEPPPAVPEQPWEQPAVAPFEPTDETGEVPFLRERPRRYGTSFWVWAFIGLLLHLVALGILIVVIIRWSTEEKKRNKGRGELRPATGLVLQQKSETRNDQAAAPRFAG